jgi:hypothetical protein
MLTRAFYLGTAVLLLIYTKLMGQGICGWWAKFATYTTPHAVAVLLHMYQKHRSPLVSQKGLSLTTIPFGMMVYAVVSFVVVNGSKNFTIPGGFRVLLSRIKSDRPAVHLPPPPDGGKYTNGSAAIRNTVYDVIDQGGCRSCVVCALSQMLRWHRWNSSQYYPSVDSLMVKLEADIGEVKPICEGGTHLSLMVASIETLVGVPATPNEVLSAGDTYWCRSKSDASGACQYLHAFYQDGDSTVGLRNDQIKSIPPHEKLVRYSVTEPNRKLFTSVPLNLESAKLYLAYGPCMVSIIAVMLQHKVAYPMLDDPVYSTPPANPSTGSTHAVLLYGIKENEDGTAEYMLKNSWGASSRWAFFRVKVGSNGLGIEDTPFGIGLIALTPGSVITQL